MRRGMPSLAVVVLVVAAVGFGAAGPALAVPPSNDTEDTAVLVDTVPFTHSIDTSGATAGGPRFCSNHASVFYAFTPSVRGRVQVDLMGSDYDTTLGVYTRDAAGKLRAVGCNDDRFGVASGLRFRANPGTTYFFLVGRCCGNARRGGPGGGQLVITVGRVADAPLEYEFQIADTGTIDPATGIATVSGTATCSERSFIYQDGLLRQLRQGLFVARAYWYVGMACQPDGVVQWSVEVDTETGIAFGAGSALVRLFYGFATDGWRDYVERYAGTETTIQLG